jgi:hypothetical protein
VHTAYAKVPGVIISGHSGSVTFSYTLLLHKGVIAREEFVGKQGSSGTTKLVSAGTTTYELDPGTSCWKAVEQTAPEAFRNIGLHYPDQAAMRVKSPRRTQIGWSLPIVQNGTSGVLRIDPRTLLVTSVDVGTASGSATFTEQVNALESAPRLFASTPRCPSS